MGERERVVLGQRKVDTKSNEITAMPELLKVLDLHDKLVTTDALGCQKAIAETIVAGGGDYILAVKDNRPTLHAEIKAAFAVPGDGGTMATLSSALAAIY